MLRNPHVAGSWREKRALPRQEHGRALRVSWGQQVTCPWRMKKRRCREKGSYASGNMGDTASLCKWERVCWSFPIPYNVL